MELPTDDQLPDPIWEKCQFIAAREPSQEMGPDAPLRTWKPSQEAPLKPANVLAWGAMKHGQLSTKAGPGLGNGKGTSTVQHITANHWLSGKTPIWEIACGKNFCGVVKEDGNVAMWGAGNDGQLGNGTFSTADGIPNPFA